MSTKLRVTAPTAMQPTAPYTRSEFPSEAQPPLAGATRTRPSRIVLAAAAVLVALCIGAYFAIRAYTKPTPPEPFTLTGTLLLNSDSIRTSGLPTGFNCAGSRGYDDVGPGAPVTVADETGKLLAKGAIESSYGQQGFCMLRFKVDAVPGGAKFYRVQVAHRGEMSYTEAEAKAGVDLSLGSSEPSSTATPTAGPSQSTPSPTRPSTPVGTPTPVPEDPETVSLNQLRATANSDRPYVMGLLANRWVPQLSSKRPGLVAEGIVWDNAKTLYEHLQLRQRYPGVRLLRSGDWSTFDAPDFWITVAGISFADPRGALAWCSSQMLDRDHCYAKLISTIHSVDDSTAYNK